MNQLTNAEIFDRLVRYQVFLERYKSGSVKRLREFLLELDADLASQIERRLDRMTKAELANLASAGRAETERLKALRDFFADVEKAASVEILDRVTEEVTPIGELKAARTVQSMQAATVQAVAMPSIARIESAIRLKPFEGRVLKEYAAEWSESRLRRVNQALRLGLAQGETSDQIAKRLRGTKSQNYKDGILELSRRGALSIVRTAANHAAAVGDGEAFIRNADRIEKVVWTSVLDTRTSSICRGNDGREFEAGKEVGIPAHFNCRSFWTPVMKNAGNQPKGETYGSWIKRQPREVQEEALGPTRAKLLREGGLDYKDLVNQATREEYTLAQLRDREASAFGEIE